MDTGLKNLKFGNTYAVQTGDYAGQLFIFIKANNQEYSFLSIPHMQNIKIPKAKLDFAFKHNIISLVERLPHYVRKIASLQFNKNEKLADESS
jgi:hypothetical protein